MNDHQPVLLEQVMAALAIKPGGCYVDATFGRGGHASAIVEQLDDQGRLIALDQDREAIAFGEQRFADDDRVELVHGNFSDIAEVLEARGLIGKVDGVLMDLGVSSPQLDDAKRGFSFLRDGPLDMRMDDSSGISAREWLAEVGFDELVTVLKRFGEERFAKRIATAIIERRAQEEITTTGMLSSIISDAIPVKEKNKHPATRSFQAIRIHINDELGAAEAGLRSSAEALAVGGRLAVITFHSLEDRLVKRFMRDNSRAPSLPKELPVLASDEVPPFRVVGKPAVADERELASNPRSRSARLRVLERVH